MNSGTASSLFEALSSVVRLDLFRLLVRNAPAGLVAGEIARQLHIPSTNLSFHLKAIVSCGLVRVERQGRYMRYTANIPLMLELIGYLTAECCEDDPAACLRFRAASGLAPGLLPGRALPAGACGHSAHPGSESPENGG